ncbi:dTDP-glucose 4,6-dehydratase [Candidatus Sumerlaeota bacterium]|nr:dTDP-glucose 4,6-dehydratase [Candidatus Sumerlaeota bacterium]
MNSSDTYLVTGGCGFIGSSFILLCRKNNKADIVNLDALTYAGNPLNLAELQNDSHYHFHKGDIGDKELVASLLEQYKPDAIVNFAAESHVDRSIFGPEDFMKTNIMGTFHLLQVSLDYWERHCKNNPGKRFRFLHVSTDEVYGSLGSDDPPFQETTPYSPNSPYSASKAASDHLVRAYVHTFGFPGAITNCSNNYGPRQFPEKLIPLMILNAREGKPLPVYGDGMNVRDWIFVNDHCEAILSVLDKGTPGETYNIGGNCEKPNIEIVRAITGVMDELFPDSPHVPHSSLIHFVKDRPGHDRRYAVDCSKITRELGWKPSMTFEQGLNHTVQWYMDNPQWVGSVRSGDYLKWLEKNYEKRS